MDLICSDLEGVFVPEIWINVAEKTGVSELKLTTRDIADYDVLMKKRLEILKENQITLSDIQSVIAGMRPFDGSLEFLNDLRSKVPVVIVSDTFAEFAGPLMRRLGWPTLFCHCLSVDEKGMIADYHLRQPEGKKKTVRALQTLNYKVIAMGDSYNDTAMLQAADYGLLFKPPQNVINEFPQFPVCTDYETLKSKINALRQTP